MPSTIKIKCNGPGKHLNEVNLQKSLEKDVVLRGTGTEDKVTKDVPARIVLPCRECTVGKVIVTREMILANR